MTPDTYTIQETLLEVGDGHTLYISNTGFMPDNYIFDNASKLTMPIWLVQGRQDMVCPPVTAYELDQKLPNSNLLWTTSGHRAERESWNVTRTILMQLTEKT